MPACKICRQHCSKNFSLIRHVQTVHGNAKVQCGDCHKFFARPDNLRKHSKNCRKPQRKTPNIEPSIHPSIDEYSQLSEDRSQAHSTVAQVPPVALEYSPEQFDIALSYHADSQLSEYNESPTNPAAFFDLVQSPKSEDWLSLPDAPWETHVSLPNSLHCVAMLAYQSYESRQCHMCRTMTWVECMPMHGWRQDGIEISSSHNCSRLVRNFSKKSSTSFVEDIETSGLRG